MTARKKDLIWAFVVAFVAACATLAIVLETWTEPDAYGIWGNPTYHGGSQGWERACVPVCGVWLLVFSIVLWWRSKQNEKTADHEDSPENVTSI